MLSLEIGFQFSFTGKPYVARLRLPLGGFETCSFTLREARASLTCLVC